MTTHPLLQLYTVWFCLWTTNTLIIVGFLSSTPPPPPPLQHPRIAISSRPSSIIYKFSTRSLDSIHLSYIATSIILFPKLQIYDVSSSRT